MKRYTGFDELLKAKNSTYSDAPAFCYDCDGAVRTVTYGQWNADVHAEAQKVKESGYACIGIVCDGSYACVVMIFSCVLAGCQTVLLEAMQNAQERQDALVHTDAEAIWMRGELRETGTHMAQEERNRRNGRILFFTSGTTAHSRAVVLSDASLMNSAYNGGCMLPLTQNDRMLCVLPLSHVFGFVCSLLWPLSFGACVALSRGMRHYIDDCAYFQPTVLSAVPTLLQFLLKYNALNPQLHTILVGAGDCPPDVLQAVQKSGRHISFGYGLTETSSGVAISIGEDPLAMSVCPDDTITLAEDGEILIYAPTCIMQGYYKDRAGTEEILQDGILHTGDIGMIDENGCLRIRGRKKEVLVFADGTKIYLPEYESRLAAALNNPETAVVMKDSRPVLVMQNNGMSRQDVMDAIGPVMKMYSRGRQIADVLFTDHPLPRTATGKIRRWQLQKEIGL